MRILCLAISCAVVAGAQTVDQLELRGVAAESKAYRGVTAVHVTPLEAAATAVGGLALVKGSDFSDGTIEVEVSGVPRAGSFEGARGFVGIAFHTAGDKYEAFYLRPTNGRADDQLRRNHSTQYIAQPEWPWERLRKESPGLYESYVDLQPGVWTKMKIVVAGKKASLYVNGAEQPCLIVNDLKGPSQGAIALWVGPGTDAHFANLKVTK
jgi:hypothetical protein